MAKAVDDLLSRTASPDLEGWRGHQASWVRRALPVVKACSTRLPDTKDLLRRLAGAVCDVRLLTPAVALAQAALVIVPWSQPGHRNDHDHVWRDVRHRLLTRRWWSHDSSSSVVDAWLGSLVYHLRRRGDGGLGGARAMADLRRAMPCGVLQAALDDRTWIPFEATAAPEAVWRTRAVLACLALHTGHDATSVEQAYAWLEGRPPWHGTRRLWRAVADGAEHAAADDDTTMTSPAVSGGNVLLLSSASLRFFGDAGGPKVLGEGGER